MISYIIRAMVRPGVGRRRWRGRMDDLRRFERGADHSAAQPCRACPSPSGGDAMARRLCVNSQQSLQPGTGRPGRPLQAQPGELCVHQHRGVGVLPDPGVLPPPDLARFRPGAIRHGGAIHHAHDHHQHKTQPGTTRARRPSSTGTCPSGSDISLRCTPRVS